MKAAYKIDDLYDILSSPYVFGDIVGKYYSKDERYHFF